MLCKPILSDTEVLGFCMEKLSLFHYCEDNMDTIDTTILLGQAKRKVVAIREQAEALVAVLRHIEDLIKKGQGEGGGHHPPGSPL